MIIEGVLGLFFKVLGIAFQGLEVIALPHQVINTLATITAYGTWIVGIDILGIVLAVIVSWWMIKFTVGLVVWLWELLPLT